MVGTPLVLALSERFCDSVCVTFPDSSNFPPSTSTRHTKSLSISLILVTFCCSWLPVRTIMPDPDPIHTASFFATHN
ncbi:MAG TPA: hypothetical protein V6C97_26470, partial [Oculatellaceae cyanobacterium]